MIDIFVTVFFVYIIYYFVSVNRYDKSGHVKKKKGRSLEVADYEALPSEVKYFITKYKVDLKKVNLRGLLKLTGLTLGIDIAVVSLFALLLSKNFVVEIIVALFLIIPVYLISLKVLAKNFKKKGLIKDV